MIQVGLPRDALGRVRLSYSPLWELTASLRLLLHEREHLLHKPWIEWASARIDEGVLDVLAGLMPTAYICPDFVTPPPGGRPRSFRKELAAIAETDLDTIRSEVDVCWGGRPAGSLGALLDRGEDSIRQLTQALEEYWTSVLAPVWPQLRAVLTADLTFRADEIAGSGLSALFDRLNPSIRFDGETLSLAFPRCAVTRDAGRDGVVLVPNAFAWPNTRIVVREPYPVTIGYPPRGVGTLWHSHPGIDAHAAARLIGTSRATILSLLDFPLTTTQLAEKANLSLPATSQHLTVLRANGLVGSRRAGRIQWNSRTELGRALLDAGRNS